MLHILTEKVKPYGLFSIPSLRSFGGKIEKIIAIPSLIGSGDNVSYRVFVLVKKRGKFYNLSQDAPKWVLPEIETYRFGLAGGGGWLCSNNDFNTMVTQYTKSKKWGSPVEIEPKSTK